MTFKKKDWLKTLWALAGFLIVSFGQPGWLIWLGPLAAICGYALFWRFLLFFNKQNHRFLLATGWYACIQAIHLSWMTAYEFQGIYILFVHFMLSLCLGVQFGCLCLLIPKHELKAFRIFAIAGFWTLMEWSRLYFLCGFSWNPAGLSLACNLFSMQLAAFWGVLGLSFWTMLTNLFVLKIIFLKNTTYNWFLSILNVIVLVLFPYLFGWMHITYHDHNSAHFASSSGVISAVLVQPGLLPSEKTLLHGRIKDFVSPYEQWQKILQFLKLEYANHPNYIILPESAVPFCCASMIYQLDKAICILKDELCSKALDTLPPLEFPFATKRLFQGKEVWFVSNAFWLQAISNYFMSEVIAGVDHQIKRDQGDFLNFNSAFHFIPFANHLKSYEKRILLPFAEYPLIDELKPLLKKCYGISEFFTPGGRHKIFEGRHPFSVSICYEETFSDFIRESKMQGAELLINVTNDNWYPYSRLPVQHFNHGRLRAIENGIPLLRACNSGVTSAIDSCGRVVGELKNSRGALFVSVPTYHFATLYTFWGDGGIVGLSSIVFVLFWSLKKKTIDFFRN